MAHQPNDGGYIFPDVTIPQPGDPPRNANPADDDDDLDQFCVSSRVFSERNVDMLDRELDPDYVEQDTPSPDTGSVTQDGSDSSSEGSSERRYLVSVTQVIKGLNLKFSDKSQSIVDQYCAVRFAQSSNVPHRA